MNRLLLIIALLLNAVYANDEEGYEDDGEESKVQICTSTLSAYDFVNKNQDIFTFTVSRFDWVKLLDIYKGKYSSNYEIREVEPGQWSSSKFKPQLQDFYWGIEKNDYKKPIRIDTANCFPVARAQEFDAALRQYFKKSKSPLYEASYDYNLPLIKKLIQEKKFYSTNKEPDWDSFREITAISQDLALDMLQNGFPVEETKRNESVLLEAASGPYLKLLNEAIKRKANPNFKSNINDITPILAAIIMGEAANVESLLKAGAKVDSTHLCYISGHPNFEEYIKRDVSEDRVKITRLLLSRKLDPNVKCHDSDIVSRLYSEDDLAIFKILMDNGLKIDLKKNYSEQFLSTIWEKYPDVQVSTREKYNQFKNELATKDPAKDSFYLGQAIEESIRFQDFEFYKKVIDHIKPNIQFSYAKKEGYKSCSTDPLRNAKNSQYLEYALKNGLKTLFDCDGQGYSGNAPFIDEIVSRCNVNQLKFFSDSDLRKAQIKADQNQNFQSPQCLETLKYLKAKGNAFADNFLLMRYLKSNDFRLINFILESSLVSQVAIDELKTYLAKGIQRDQHNDPEETIISKKTERYFLSKLSSAKLRTPKTSTSLHLNFAIGEHYPLCAIDEEFRANLRSGHRTLPACSQLNSWNITYFEIKSVEGDSVTAVAVSPNNDWYRAAGIIFGEKFIFPKDKIASAEYLKSGSGNFPVTKLGLKSVKLVNSKIVMEGSHDICERDLSLKLPENISLIKHHEIDQNRECVNNSDPN